MTLLIVLGCLLGYILAGLMLARFDRPRAIRRSCVMANQYLMVFCWPVFGIIAIVNGGATLAIERVDPRVHQLQQKRIADPERELGVRP